MGRKTKGEDRIVDNLDKVGAVPPIDGEYEIHGRRVLSQEGATAPMSKCLLKKELSDRIHKHTKFYPVYAYVLNYLTVEPSYEIPRVNFCNQILEEIKAHMPYHILSPQELEIALKITPRLFSANAVDAWGELGWAEKEFLAEQKFPLPLQVAMTRYVANPEKYAEEKGKEIKSLQYDKSKHIRELRKLQNTLMDYYEPNLLVDVVDQIMKYKPKKR